MDTERKQIALLAGLTLVIVGIAFFSARWMTRGNSSTSGTNTTVTTASVPPVADTKAAAQQAQVIASLQTATSFVWADFVPLSTPPYTRKEFYIYRNNASTKLASKSGTLTDVFTAKGIIYFVVDDKRIFQYNPESGLETSIVDASKKVSLLAVSPDATKIAFGETSAVDSSDRESITVKIWDKTRRTLTELATLNPEGAYFGFTSLVWSHTYNQLYAVQQGGDGGGGLTTIHQLNQSSKEVSNLKTFATTADLAVNFLGFDAKGDTFFVSESKGENPVTEVTVKRYTASGLSEEDVYHTTTANTVAAQGFAFGPDGTPLIMSNSNLDERDVKADALGFFSIQEGKTTKLVPGIGLNFAGTANPEVRAANDASYLFGYVDSGTYRVYLGNLAAKKSTLIHSVPSVGETSDIVFFRGWVK